MIPYKVGACGFPVGAAMKQLQLLGLLGLLEDTTTFLLRAAP